MVLAAVVTEVPVARAAITASMITAMSTTTTPTASADRAGGAMGISAVAALAGAMTSSIASSGILARTTSLMRTMSLVETPHRTLDGLFVGIDALSLMVELCVEASE